jgi:uncharacterized protein
MLVVLSPAKSLDFESPLPKAAGTRTLTEPALLPESEKLIKTLRRMSPEDLSELMDISSALGELNFRRYAEWHTPFTAENAKPALFAFTGDVYVGLDAPTLSAKDLDFAQSHLRILSGLYGVLRPLDLMQAYRLEMGTHLQQGKHRSLYEFWGGRITEQLNQELQQQKSRVLVNLASNEYFKSVQAKKLGADIISPVFKDYKNGQYKIISFFAKKARGSMTAFIIKNRIAKAADLQGFDLDGYKFSPEDSTAESPVFLRRSL